MDKTTLSDDGAPMPEILNSDLAVEKAALAAFSEVANQLKTLDDELDTRDLSEPARRRQFEILMHILRPIFLQISDIHGLTIKVRFQAETARARYGNPPDMPVRTAAD